MSEWADRTHTVFNIKPSKSSAVLFTRLTGELYPHCPPLALSGHTLPYEVTYKYLGLTLDAGLKWYEHAKTAIGKAIGTSAQISRIVHRSRAFSVHTVATLIRTILIPRCTYASQFWKFNVVTYRKLDSAAVRPLKRALGLYWNTHHLSIMVECDILSTKRYVLLFGQNYISRAINNPSNPSTRAVSEHARALASDEKLNSSLPHSFVFSRKAMTAAAALSADTDIKAKSKLKADQTTELLTAKWGSSLRCAMPVGFVMGKQHHIATESLSAAQTRAKFRFDTISPWRDYAKSIHRNPALAVCKWCHTTVARASHFIHCTGLLRIRRVRTTIAACKRTINSKLNSHKHRKKQSFVQTILSGHHPLLDTKANADLMRDSLTALRQLLIAVKSHAINSHLPNDAAQ